MARNWVGLSFCAVEIEYKAPEEMANLSSRRGSKLVITSRCLTIAFIIFFIVQSIFMLKLTRGMRGNDDSDISSSLSSLHSSLLHHDQLLDSNEESQHQDDSAIDLEAELQKSIQYAQSIGDTKRRLIFVHIPKTAGTAIEEVGGKQARIAWGSCRFNHKPKRRGGVCQYPPGQFEWPMKIGWWHLPTKLFPLSGIDPYEHADLFGVVRDPFERLVSEFYYICRKKVSKWWDAIECNTTRIHDADYLNEWIQHKLMQTKLNRSSAESYLDQNGHFTPQYDFVVDLGNVEKNDIPIRRLDYVLNMDNLQIEFDALMKAYGIDAAMPNTKFNSAFNIARNVSQDLKETDLNEKTRSMVQDIYKHDITLLDAILSRST